MKKLHILAMTFFSMLAVVGLMSANGVTGNLAAGCDCISDACIKACGPEASLQCCTTQAGELREVPAHPSWPGYTASFLGFAGFFTILAMNKREEDIY